MDLWGLAAQGGPAAVLLLVVFGFWKGYWRTQQEVAAWQQRAERAEKLVDGLLPALDQLTEAIERESRTRLK